MTVADGYLVCEKGIVKAVFAQLPERYRSFPLEDYSNKLVIPGLTDLHVHAPQYAFEHVKPILTPRFLPTCSDELMRMLSRVQKQFDVRMQSHLSENIGEIAWVQELMPSSRFYGDAYDKFSLFGGDVPTIMAHCVHSTLEEMKLSF